MCPLRMVDKRIAPAGAVHIHSSAPGKVSALKGHTRRPVSREYARLCNREHDVAALVSSSRRSCELDVGDLNGRPMSLNDGRETTNPERRSLRTQPKVPRGLNERRVGKSANSNERSRRTRRKYVVSLAFSTTTHAW